MGLVSVDLRASEISQDACRTLCVKHCGDWICENPKVPGSQVLTNDVHWVSWTREPRVPSRGSSGYVMAFTPARFTLGSNPAVRGVWANASLRWVLGLASILELALVLPSFSEPIGYQQSSGRDFLKRSFRHGEVHSKRKKHVFISRAQCLGRAVRLQLTALPPNTHSVPDNQRRNPNSKREVSRLLQGIESCL